MRRSTLRHATPPVVRTLIPLCHCTWLLPQRYWPVSDIHGAPAQLESLWQALVAIAVAVCSGLAASRPRRLRPGGEANRSIMAEGVVSRGARRHLSPVERTSCAVAPPAWCMGSHGVHGRCWLVVKGAQLESAGSCTKLRSTATPAHEAHAAARGGSRSSCFPHPPCTRIHLGPPPGAPSDPTRPPCSSSRMHQLGGRSGRNGDLSTPPAGAKRPPIARIPQISLPGRSAHWGRAAPALERSAGLHSDAQGRPERS